ncbi:MAG: hypothetical protein Q4D62_07315 [Planctomycetia bacterium]|nr:hypothetical protein [Planctomycetia bacterium]
MNPSDDRKPVSPQEEAPITSMLGVGLDHADGEVRLTRGENFALVGGSQQTHEWMQETVCKVNENIQKRGKTLQELSRKEFQDVFQEVVEKIGK